MKVIIRYIPLSLLIILSSAFSFPIESDVVNNASPEAASSLVFPVAGKKARIGSFWGAARDGGSRKHEGIDIFAARKTPVVAVADGFVSVITTSGRGGKTIWLRSPDHQMTFYYAHLDKQFVKTGDNVKKGQIIGHVGNTGNARLTPPHLHFGIYTYSGAIDPLPFVKKSPRIQLPVKQNRSKEVIAKSH
jgi:murein DD-endopeptidase MepM/ murein hydrolase activator NlpD